MWVQPHWAVFWFCTGKYCPRSTNLARLERWQRIILPVQIGKTTIIVFIAKELKIRKSDITLQWLHFVMASLCQGTKSYCNGCVAFKKAVCKYLINKDVCFCFRFFFSSMFINKTTSFLTTDYTGKYQPFDEDY